MKNNPLNFTDRFGLEGKPAITTSMIVGEVLLGGHIRGRNAIKRNLDYINSFTNNAEYIKSIIYEEQSHLTPDEILLDGVNYDFGSYGKSRGLGQINYKPSKTDIEFFGYPTVPISSVVDERTNISLMNDRLEIIKSKLEEYGQEITMKNIGSAWNGGKSCIILECDSDKADKYGIRTEGYYSIMGGIENEKTFKEELNTFLDNTKNYVSRFNPF